MLKTLIYLCILVHWGWYGIAAMVAIVVLTTVMWILLRSVCSDAQMVFDLSAMFMFVCILIVGVVLILFV
jgi:bacteriorhodopsin